MKTKLNIRNYMFFFSGCLIMHFNVAGQGNCSNTIYDANKIFESGDFAKSESLLLPCLKSGFTREEKFEGYRLLALDYIYLNKSEQADTAVKNMLKKKPSYKLFPNINDPVAFTKILNTFEVVPSLTIGGNLGINITNINLKSNHQAAYTTASYIPVVGYQFGVEVNYLILKGLHATGGIQYSSIGYEHDFDSVAAWSQKFTENITYTSIPLSARYYFLKNDNIIRPWVEAGICFEFLSTDQANIIATDISNGNSSRVSVDPSTRRNKSNTSILYGAGINIWSGNGWITASARYLYGLSPVVNADQRYNDLNFIFNYQYIDDDFNMNRWVFSFGYTLPIHYKVKKIKN